MSWKPIETAPDDGRSILVVGGRYPEAEKVDADGDWWRNVPLPGITPTHWMPLPEPPKED